MQQADLKAVAEADDIVCVGASGCLPIFIERSEIEGFQSGIAFVAAVSVLVAAICGIALLFI
ncbi:hypothetical protein ACM7U6_21275 [Pseudomonas aeruginosa]|nr:hypothetical protein [Pseudomonas aeruginosa]